LARQTGGSNSSNNNFNSCPRRGRLTPDGGGSFKIHASRILRFTGPSVPTPEYEAQQWWGISVLEPAYEEIRKRDNLSWNILSVSFRSNLIGIEFPELAQMLSGVGANQAALVQFQQPLAG